MDIIVNKILDEISQCINKDHYIFQEYLRKCYPELETLDEEKYEKEYNKYDELAENTIIYHLMTLLKLFQ